MTIYLPEEINLLRQAFDVACERILNSEKDAVFYALFAELISCLRDHVLLREYILELEAELAKRNYEFNTSALEALEDTWLRLWKAHCWRFKFRKQLVQIKYMITAPNESSYTPLYHRILFRISEFLYQTKQDSSEFISPKIAEIEQKFFIPGRNSDHIRQNMQIMAETIPVFCWERIRFFEQCYTSNKPIPNLKPSKGHWISIREQAWKSALQKCEIEVLIGAKQILMQKLSTEGACSVEVFFMCEHQIHRKDTERYLNSLKNLIHIQLIKIESTQLKAKENPDLTLPGTLKADFVVHLASKYWKIHPLAKRDDVFNDYLSHCPVQKQLSRDRWDQIIRKRKLDPRPKAAIKRGSGKKTLQN